MRVDDVNAPVAIQKRIEGGFYADSIDAPVANQSRTRVY